MSEEAKALVKKNMTDEERLALAAKLDRELDDFIDGLEKKKYTDGWPEDRWREEMDKHPFFMKEAPKDGDALHPLMEGMQQLKYDPLENTHEELAATYKEDGNFYMKNKKYRMAILSYTEGIKFKIDNAELNATLHNNRSAANFFLKNYRSSLFDAERAFFLKPDYEKAIFRAAQCCLYLERFDKCTEYCDKLLATDPTHSKANELRKECVLTKNTKAKDERKLAMLQKRKQDKINRTITELEKRKIKFEENRDNGTIVIDYLKPRLAPLEDFMVSADENGVLSWPVVFCYPEFLYTDFQQQLSEEVILYDCLITMLEEPLEFDVRREYHTDNVNAYYENRLSAKVHKIDVKQSIKEIVSSKFFLVHQGTITLYIVTKDLEAERTFLNQRRIPLSIR